MPSIIDTFTQGRPPGTLSSTNLYINPNIPRNSQAQGLNGTDNRGYTRTVGNNELVEYRLNNLTNDPNNQYLSQARGEAQRQGQTRGLGNSSISAGSGVRAAIQSALPIASQDASTYSAAQAQNLDAMNSNLMQERDIQNRMLDSERNRTSQTDINAMNSATAAADRQNRLLMQRENLAYQGEQAGLGRGHDLEVMGTEYGLRDMFANSQLGRDITTMGAENQFRNNFADNDALRQDWLDSGAFDREFYGSMSQMMLGSQIGSTADFFSNLNNYAMNNPDVFNAEDYTNFSNFVNTNMSSVFSNIFGNFFGGRSGGNAPRPGRGG